MIDKVFHFLINAILGAIAGTLVVVAGEGSAVAAAIAVLFCCIPMSVAKEWADMRCPGNKWDWYDFLADMIGMAVALIWSILMVISPA